MTNKNMDYKLLFVLFFVKDYLEAVIEEKLHIVLYCTKIGLFYNILNIFQSQEFLIFVSSDQIRNH